MKRFLGKIRDKRVFLAVILFGCIFLFFIGNFALAEEEVVGEITGVGKAIATVLSWIAYVFIMVFGGILTLLIKILVNIAQVNNIIDVPAVVKGWVIVRDLCNMFFVVIFLIIAFATILKIESYNVKKMLPKLLIMAVLINFSRTIFGLLIDFSQVIMLTFVSSFSEFGHGNFIAMFQTDKITAIGVGMDKVTAWPVVVAIITGVIALIITNIVVLVMVAILVMRIIMLWIYTIFSPLIFLGFVFPPLQKYTGKIWEDFTKQLVVGPVLAFFIWLALATASESSNKLGTSSSLGGEELCSGLNKLFCEGSFQTFIITIGLLMGGLMIAQQMGGAAGSIAGKGLSSAKGVLSGAAKVAMAPLKGAKMGAGAIANFGIDSLHQKTGVDLNLPRAWKTLQASRQAKKSRMYAEGMGAAGMARADGSRIHGLLATTGDPGGSWDQIVKGFSLRHPITKGMKQMLKGGKGMATRREKLLPEIEQAKFKEEFSNMGEGGVERTEALVDLKKKSYELDQDIGKESDPEKLKELEKERENVEDKLDFARSNKDRKFTDEETEGFKDMKEAKQEELNKNIPIYSVEAKSAEEKAVAVEMDNIKKVDDQAELVRMLKESIQGGEKSRIKAIIRKLTADYNDNEAFEALVPEAGSGYEGLQELMRQLSTKGSANYAGFEKQEAFSLGAQVAEMNKKTNHWEAAAAYKMENGQWRETTAEEHAYIASTEFGKNSSRANAKSFNRLAMGKHVVDPKTGKESYKLADTGLIALQSWDNSTNIDRMLEDMTESTAKYLVPFLKKLEDKGFFKAKGLKSIGKDHQGDDIFPNLADMIKLKANEAKVDFSDQLANVTGISKEINK